MIYLKSSGSKLQKSWQIFAINLNRHILYILQICPIVLLASSCSSSHHVDAEQLTGPEGFHFGFQHGSTGVRLLDGRAPVCLSEGRPGVRLLDDRALVCLIEGRAGVCLLDGRAPVCLLKSRAGVRLLEGRAGVRHSDAQVHVACVRRKNRG
jgi:hypothetical protein